MEQQSSNWLVGIDIGGTFTDLVALDRRSGRRAAAKVLTNRPRPLEGVLDVLRAAAAQGGPALDEIDLLVHATTLPTNTLIEREGARAALLTTHGFRDVLETGTESRYDLYDLELRTPPPLVPRALRLTVGERVGAGGEVVAPLDVASVQAAVSRLRAEAVESVAVGFLNAYADDGHERAVVDILRHELPDVFVTWSADVAPVIREHARFVATVVNAYVGPSVSAYLADLDGALRERGFTGELGVLKSDGGMCSPAEASRQPVRILESSPAGGIVAAAAVARGAREPLCIAFDMGGTTAKASLIVNGEPLIAEELEVARRDRLKAGSGLRLCIASMDLLEIGAGGGSIASVGPLGLLGVGPASAGSDPGPAAYGRGGARATVTDADLLLGYLDPERFAHGSMPLDVTAAAEAVERDVVVPLGLAGLTDGAWAIHDLINESMARAIRLNCVEHGVDPSAATLIATGGAGPVHAANLLAKLGCRRLIVPSEAGVASAGGLLQADRMLEKTVTSVVALDELTADAIATRLAAIELAMRAGQSPDLVAHGFLHLRLRGQAYDVRVALPDCATPARVAVLFAEEYQRRHGRPPVEGRVEVVHWTVRLAAPRTPTPATIAAAVTAALEPAGRRQAFFGPAGWRATAVVSCAALAAGARVAGPAVVEYPTTTVVLPPGHTARVTAALDLEVRVDA